MPSFAFSHFPSISKSGGRPMKRQYTVDGQAIELEAIPDMLGVRFKEPARYSNRAAVVRRPELCDFEDRFEVPHEKFTVFKIAATPQTPEQRLESAVAAVASEELVERVSPVFAVGDVYMMATDRLLVGFKNAAGAKKILKDVGEVLHKEGNEYVVTISADQDPFDAVAKLDGYDEVEYAEPDFVSLGAHLARYAEGSQATGESDPLADQQYAIRITKAEEAWQLQRGKPNIRIAVLDEGVRHKT